VRRSYISLFLTILLLAFILYGFFWIKNKRYVLTDPFSVFGNQVVGVIETNRFIDFSSSLTNSSLFWKEMVKSVNFETADKGIRQIDSLLRNSPELKELRACSFILSLHRTGKEYGLLLQVSPTANKGADYLLKHISEGDEISRRKVGGVNVYDIRIESGEARGRYSFFEKGGMLAISPSAAVIEETINQLNRESSGGNTSLNKLRPVTGKDVPAKLYLNYRELNQFVNRSFLHADDASELTFAGWSALDIDLANDNITLNGFSTLSDSIPDVLSAFPGQQPVNFKAFEIIPSNAVWFRLLGFSNPGLFFSQTGSVTRDPDWRRNAAEVASLSGFDLVQELRELTGKEAGEVLLKNSPSNFDKYFLMEIKGRSLAADLLNRIPGTVSTSETAEEEPVYRSPLVGIPRLLFGALCAEQSWEYFGFSGNYLVFGESYESVKSFLYQSSLEKTLRNDEYFNSLSDNFSSRSNYFLYANPGLCYDYILSRLNTNTREKIKKYDETWKKLSVFAVQSTSEDNLNYQRVFMRYSSQARELVNTVWQRKLDATAGMKPAIVQNHLNGQKEIFIQDVQNRIYLIANDGKILWKQQLEGAIIGEVLQLDYYRNSKLQYIFTTKNKIYLIDRNGNPVEKFPLTLREPATAGISLFDYEKDGTLRIAVPCGKKLYMYDKNGNSLAGFSFNGADHEITHPAQHIRIGERDFIVIKDRYQVYFLDRRGKPRARPSATNSLSVNNPLCLDPLARRNETHLLASDTSGTVWQYFFDGKVKKALSLNLAADHFFLPADLDGNGTTEYVFTSGNKLLVYTQNGDLVFENELPDPILLRPVIYEFSSNDKKIGVVATKTGNIYLFNNDGSIYKGFPLKGTTLYSISSFPGLKARFNLIVGNYDNFLYNYSVK
jgi:hypothetical protein